MLDRNTEKLMALLRAGEVALELWRAEEKAANARAAYHVRIRRYERLHHNGERLKMDPANPAHAAIIEYTRERYDAALSAKRRVHSIRQKLRRICVKVARLSAMGQESEANNG